MSVTYRDAAPADAAALADAFAAVFTETFAALYDPADLALFLAGHSAERWRAELVDPAFAVRLAEADGAIAGFAKLGPFAFPTAPCGAALDLRQLYVRAPWRGSGVAAALMDWLIAEARRRGAAELYLSVFVGNHRAQKFYRRIGFTDVGPYAFMVGNQADEDVIMKLALP